MKQSTKAALLSGLIFPGIGHLALKEYVRASILILAAVGTVYVMTTAAYDQAMTVVDRIESGEVALDSQAIVEAIGEATTSSSAEADNRAANASLFILGACWLFGIVDSWRLGNAEDKKRAAESA